MKEVLKNIILNAITHYSLYWTLEGVFCKTGIEETIVQQEKPKVMVEVWIQFKSPESLKIVVFRQSALCTNLGTEQEMLGRVYENIIQAMLQQGFAAAYMNLAKMVRERNLMPPAGTREQYPLTKEEMI